MSKMTVTLIIFLLLAVARVPAVNNCYFCFFQCSVPAIEPCSIRYGKNRTTCISIKTVQGQLYRKQCMSINQATAFCTKFKRYKDVICDTCDRDLCNAAMTSSSFLIPFIIGIATIKP